jgi:hypothetical protein
MKTSELLAKVEMLPIPKAKNLRAVGWADGYMVVRFRTGAALYIFGPSIAEVERDKLLRSPYPDGLWSKLRKKHAEDWKSHKVEINA